MTNDNKLKKVNDESTILSLLTSAKEAETEVFIWKLVGNSKHLAHVRIEAIRKARKDFCIVPDVGQDRQVQELMASQNFIDLLKFKRRGEWKFLEIVKKGVSRTRLF